MSDNRELAEGIADAILSRSPYGVATRIALRQQPLSGLKGERDLGGLCRIALVDVIHKQLETAQLGKTLQSGREEV